MAIYQILYAPIPRPGPSFINAGSPEQARRLFGAGLPDSDHKLIVVREVDADKVQRPITQGRAA